MVKVFATGTTGYIGGDALYALATAHPDYEITCLVRSKEKGALITKKFPSIRLVYGDLENHDLIADESTKADIVCNWADCDHVGAAKAIATGISKRTGSTTGFVVHVSGTGILCFSDLEAGTYGKLSEKVYDDWDGVGELTSLKESAPHRDVDSIVLACNTAKTKTAIVCPPTIYGPGRGPGNQRSNQAYNLAMCTLQRGKGFQAGAGLNKWTMVHVHDLSNLFLKLVEEAVKGGGIAKWGNEGYYLADNGEFAWGDVAKKIAEEAHKQGYIKTTELDSLDGKGLDEIKGFGAFMWGTNSRGKATRAKRVLGWNPTGRSLFDEIPDIVAQEAKALGLAK